jgi:hypothetical protein
VFPVQYLVSNLVLSFGVKMAQTFGYKTVMFMGGLLNAATSLVGSVIGYPPLFLVVYATFSGVAWGLVYMLPICNIFNFEQQRADGSTSHSNGGRSRQWC